MKLNPTKSAPFSTIALGSKGCAFVLGTVPEGTDTKGGPVTLPWTSFKAAGVSPRALCDKHASGRAYGGAMACYDAACYVSQKGQPIVLLPLKTALAKGVVKRLTVRITRDGKGREVSAYVPGSHKAGQKLPYYLATSELPAGRIERGLIHEAGGKPSRNTPLAWRVTLPGESDDETPKAPKTTAPKATVKAPVKPGKRK